MTEPKRGWMPAGAQRLPKRQGFHATDADPLCAAVMEHGVLDFGDGLALQGRNAALPDGRADAPPQRAAHGRGYMLQNTAGARL